MAAQACLLLTDDGMPIHPTKPDYWLLLEYHYQLDYYWTYYWTTWTK
jgi:hypothetical protein